MILPNTVFLTADDDIRSWFKDAVSSEKHIQSISSCNQCKVVTLDGPEFLNMCKVDNGKCDPFLMIESIAIMRKINN